MCANFINERRDQQFRADSQRQIFEKLFIAIFISDCPGFTQESNKQELAAFRFVYTYLTERLNRRLTSNNLTHNLPDYGHFYFEVQQNTTVARQYIHTIYVITTLRSELQPSFSYHLCCMC